MLKAGKLAVFITVISFLMISCKKDSLTDNVVNNATDNAGIFTVEVHLTETGTNNEMVYAWQRYNEDAGSNNPTIVLEQGKAYNATIKMLSSTKDIIAVTPEKRFYFEPSAASSLAVVDLNTNAKGIPVGLTSKWVTEVKGAGHIKIAIKDDTKKLANREILFNTLIK